MQNTKKFLCCLFAILHPSLNIFLPPLFLFSFASPQWYSVLNLLSFLHGWTLCYIRASTSMCFCFAYNNKTWYETFLFLAMFSLSYSSLAPPLTVHRPQAPVLDLTAASVIPVTCLTRWKHENFSTGIQNMTRPALTAAALWAPGTNWVDIY